MKTTNIKDRRKKVRKSYEDLSKLKEQQKLLYIKQKREERKRKLFQARIFTIFKHALTLALILVMVYVLLLPVWKLNPFIFSSYPNSNLIIRDNLIVKDDVILNQLKTIKYNNTPIFLFNTNEIKKKLEKLEPVKSVKTRKYLFPNRIEVIVTEKRPLFLVYKDTIDSRARYALANDGSIIPQKYFPLPEPYKNKTHNIIVANDKKKLDLQNIKDYYQMVQITEASTKEALLYLDITNPKDVRLQTKSITIRLGEKDATIFNRLKRLKAINRDIKPIKSFLDYVDLRWDKALILKVKAENKDSDFNDKIKFKEN